MTSTCLKCGSVADLPNGHRLVVCPECGAVQDEIRTASDASRPLRQSPEDPVRKEEKFSLPLVQMEMRVTGHLIECDRTSYQIRNLTATAVGRHEVPINVPEPVMKSPAPKAGLGSALLIGGIAGAFCFVLTGSAPAAGFLLSLTTFVLTSVILNRKFQAEIAPWERSAKRVKMQHDRWSALANSPVTLYSLVLETNAGSNSIFHSTEQVEIVRANEAIKDAMSKKVAEGKSLSISVLDVPLNGETKSFDVTIEQLAAAAAHQYVYGDS